MSLQYCIVHFCMCMNFHYHTNKKNWCRWKNSTMIFSNCCRFFSSTYEKNTHCKDDELSYIRMEEHVHMRIQCLQGRASVLYDRAYVTLYWVPAVILFWFSLAIPDFFFAKNFWIWRAFLIFVPKIISLEFIIYRYFPS